MQRLLTATTQRKSEDDLEIIEQHCLIFRSLFSVLKTVDKRIILNHSLKYGRQFVEIFSRLALPLIGRNLGQQKDRVSNILKSLQAGTRMLQNVCAHAKSFKDTTLTGAVPLMRKTLETFIFTVKSMLSKHNHLDALWIGNLKHRDLQGEIVSSQMPARTKAGVDAAAPAPIDKPAKQRKKRRAIQQEERENSGENFLSKSTVNTSDEEDSDGGH